VHTVLGFSSILLVLFGCSLLLILLRSLRDWSQRRVLQLLILTMPLVTLGLSVGGLHHFISRLCLVGIPLWDFLLGVVGPLAMGVISLGAFGLGIIRLVLLNRVMQRRSLVASPKLQSLVDTLAKRLHAPRTTVSLCVFARPLALTYGIRRPTVLLSTWMIENLDQRELEAVLAHELEHVARRDYLVVFLATMLRDAFFYLPTSRIAHRQLQHEKELICDDLAVGVTQRPLDLASALTKVWLHALEGPHFACSAPAQPLVEAGEAMNGRIERLLASKDALQQTQRSPIIAKKTHALIFFVLLAVQSANLIIVLVLLGCNHPL
jgi:beta-lactamase regulating signal transducer with metallopeptidase domain